MSSKRKITKEEFDRLERDIDGVIYCPHGDYEEIKTFPEYCWFPPRCDFYHGSSFGERCIFGFQCSFDVSCTFDARCDFAGNCCFEDECTFGMGCTFAEFGIFGRECIFSNRCDFAAGNNFLSNCHFGECCIFGENCTFGENTSHEHLTNSSYFACDRIGESRYKTYFFRAKEGYFVRCDEFFGTLDQFIEHVHKSYGGTRYENEYLSAVDLAKYVLDGNEPVYKVRRSEYDEGNDVLYVHFSPFKHQAYGDDDGHENIILRKDMKTDKVVGATIFYAKSEMEQRQEELMEIGYNIDIKSILGECAKMKTISCEQRIDKTFTVSDKSPTLDICQENALPGDDMCDTCHAQCEVKDQREAEKFARWVKSKPAWM